MRTKPDPDLNYFLQYMDFNYFPGTPYKFDLKRKYDASGVSEEPVRFNRAFELHTVRLESVSK